MGNVLKQENRVN